MVLKKHVWTNYQKSLLQIKFICASLLTNAHVPLKAALRGTRLKREPFLIWVTPDTCITNEIKKSPTTYWDMFTVVMSID